MSTRAARAAPPAARGSAISRRLPGAALTAGAAAALALLAAVVAFLLAGVASGPVDLGELLGSAVWDPSSGRFGGAAMIWGSIAVALLALGFAAPLGWALAVAVNEIAPARLRGALRSAAELLAVVPSIVYGLVGITYIRPLTSGVTGQPGGDSLLAAAIVLGVMVLPTTVAVSIDALSRVSGELRESASALGLTRIEAIRAAVLPAARRGMAAAALLGLARALGETVAVFLLIGRADGRLPSPGEILDSLGQPGQTITTKLNGPEAVLAGTSGAHWASLCALGLLLLAAIAALTLAGLRRRARAERSTRRPPRLHGARSARRLRDRLARRTLLALLVLPPALFASIVLVVLARGAGAGLDPSFWIEPAIGAAGGGIRDQLLGTLLLVGAAGLLAAPIGLGLGVVMVEYATPRLGDWLRACAVTLAGVPSILLGLAGYALLSTALGWSKSWLAGAIVLSAIAVPVIAISVASALESLPAGRREAASALGLRRDQLVRSIVLPHARPALVTGLLLGLARAAGETAPLLFTATVFSGADALPQGIVEEPVVALPTHIFTLAQDAADPAALQAAWGSALALLVVAGLLLLAAAPLRRRIEARSGA
ncbi:MAG: ABC transporter permease subunit [Solirubrobacteraceae bacterium]